MFYFQSLERSLKFSFEDHHIWKQYALSLYASGEYNRGLLVLKEVVRLEPTVAIHSLLAARICYEHMNLPEEGTSYSLKAMKAEKMNSTGALGKCVLYVGIGYHLQANMTSIKQDKQAFVDLAMKHFKRYL